MSRELAIAAGCGLAASLFYLSVLTGSPGALILVYLTQLPLFLAGLWLGVKGTAVAGAAGGALSLMATGTMSTLFFLLVEVAPVVVLVRQALLWRRDDEGRVWWYPPGRLVVCLVGIGMAALLGAALYLGGSAGGMEEATRQFLVAELGRFFGAGDARQVEAVATAAARFFPAVAILSWLLMATVNGVLAQGVLARFGRNLRPSPDMAEIELPSWTPYALGGIAAIAVLGSGTLGYLGVNLLVIAAIAFVFAGLAVVHAAARRFSARGIVLVGAYAFMVLFGWPILIVAALGFIEQWVGLRRRLAPAVPGRGEE